MSLFVWIFISGTKYDRETQAGGSGASKYNFKLNSNWSTTAILGIFGIKHSKLQMEFVVVMKNVEKRLKCQKLKKKIMFMNMIARVVGWGKKCLNPNPFESTKFIFCTTRWLLIPVLTYNYLGRNRKLKIPDCSKLSPFL